MGNVALGALWDTVNSSTVQPMCTSLGITTGQASQPPPPPPNPVRRVQSFASSVMGAINLPLELMNTGFALATNWISQMLPSFPAATLGSLYLGIPHCHSHPPSLVPPNPVPVPLPSMGAVMLGISVQVLINGMPAARAGDFGLAPTCGGLFPFFEIYTGSSKVFIGGNRAARMLDICKCCEPSLGTSLRGFSAVMAVAGMAIAGLGAAADAIDAAKASSAAMASAQAMAASMAAAQIAADAAATAVKEAMGKDPPVPPQPKGLGAIVLGHPNVLIGGFPIPNFPNPAMKLFEKLGKIRARRRQARAEECECSTGNCPGS